MTHLASHSTAYVRRFGGLTSSPGFGSLHRSQCSAFALTRGPLDRPFFSIVPHHLSCERPIVNPLLLQCSCSCRLFCKWTTNPGVPLPPFHEFCLLSRKKFTERSRGMITGPHIHLKGWQQAAVAVGSALGALMDPRRADLIAALGETTGKPAFERVLERMRKSPEGREVLLEQPRVVSEQVSHAWDLPEGTFGAAYAKFMGSRNFSPDDRPPVRFMETEELAYVATRAREVHDFWHVLFSLPTNLIGESALKVVEFEQMLLPMCMLSVIGGSARFSEKQRTLFFRHYFPWATRAGLRCTDLMCIYYEKHFHENLEDVRRKWGIIPCPDPKVAARPK